MTSLHLPAMLCCAAALPAQMSGTYAIDPANPAAFPSFAAAVQALVLNGIGGDVELVVAPGVYTESVLIPPIAGTSPTQSVVFRPAQGPGSVQLHGSNGDAIALLGIAFARNRSLVFDGLEFTGAPGAAISATTFVEDVEIRNCVFRGSHGATAPMQTFQAVITSDNVGDELGWRVHHNRITVSPGTIRSSIGIRVHNGGGWEIHHNTFDVTGAHHAILLENNASRVDRIHDNLFVGTMAANNSNQVSEVAGVRVDLANYENEIAGNTFALAFPGYGCCLVSGGTVLGATLYMNRIHGNVFVVAGSLADALTLNVSGAGQNPIVADGNLYDVASGFTHRIGSTITTGTFHSLASWRLATGQDTNSVAAAALLRNPFGPVPDLRPSSASPIIGLARGMPPFVVDDFAGRLRDALPDAGAYESTGFALLGAGCPGAGAQVPAMAASGTVALGSANFAIELQHAAPGALAVLVGGGSRTQSALGPLPFALGGGCRLLVSPDATGWFVTSGAGTATAALPIPAASALFGTDLFFQWGVLDSASPSPLQVAVSAGAALQL